MKLHPFLLGFALTAVSVCAQAQAQALDCKSAVTTLEMNECASRDLKTVELKLNQAYQAIMKRLSAPDTDTEKNSETKKKLIEAQRAWVKFRELDCAAVYAVNQSGSMRNLIFAGCMQGHAENRIKDFGALFPDQ